MAHGYFLLAFFYKLVSKMQLISEFVTSIFACRLWLIKFSCANLVSWDYQTNQIICSGVYSTWNNILLLPVAFLYPFLMLVNLVFKLYTKTDQDSLLSDILAIGEVATIITIFALGWHLVNERNTLRFLTEQLLQFNTFSKSKLTSNFKNP